MKAMFVVPTCPPVPPNTAPAGRRTKSFLELYLHFTSDVYYHQLSDNQREKALSVHSAKPFPLNAEGKVYLAPGSCES